MRRYSLIFMAVTGLSLFATAQYKANWYATGRLNLGTFWTTLDQTDTVPQWSTGFGAYLSLEPYITWQYKKSFALSLGGGGQLYQMTYNTDGFTYSLAYLGLKAQANAKKFISFGSQLSTFFMGMGYGYAFHSNDVLYNRKGDFEVTSNSYEDTPWFISPQVGLTRAEKHVQINMSVHYMIYPGAQPFLRVNLESPANTATTDYRGSYLGFEISADWLLPGKERAEPEIFEPEVDPEIVNRESMHSKSATLKPGKLTIKVWDHLTIDHDTISILFNGRIVLANYGLKASKKKVKVDLQPGENYLTILAHNEGEQSPNSCAISIKSGSDEYEYVLNSSMMRNEGIKIVVEE